MAWPPHTWVDGEDATTSILNGELDNLRQLHAHSHTGAVGEGANEIGPVTVAQFEAQPGHVTGTHNVARYGDDLLFWDPNSGHAIVADVTPPGWGGLLAIGTTTDTAAAGDHSHVAGMTGTATSNADFTGNTDRSIGYHNTLAEVATPTRNISLTRKAMLYVIAFPIIGQPVIGTNAAPGNTRIYVNSVVVASGGGARLFTASHAGGTIGAICNIVEYTGLLTSAGPHAVYSTHQAGGGNSMSSVIEQMVTVMEMAS